MLTVETVGMALFGLLIVGALALAVRQGAQQREQLSRYSTLHGWSVSRQGDARLSALLEGAEPDQDWSPRNVMQVEGGPESVYLFRYTVGPKGRRSNSSGNACLAEHMGRAHQAPVEIFTRTPGVEKLVGNRVKVGGKEFGDAFTVISMRPEEALATVNSEVERILLGHAADPGWYLSVTMAGRHVLVSSYWAETEQDWDYLIGLARRLRTAVR